jgi:YD repeat-containing protein
MILPPYSWRDDGKIESVTTGDRTTSYTYDALGNLETVTDPRNKRGQSKIKLNSTLFECISRGSKETKGDLLW